MASLVYNSMIEDLCKGDLEFDVTGFKVALVGSGYNAVKSHTRMTDVTNEVTGTGYTAGGQGTTVTVSKDNVSNRVDLSFSNVAWSNATVTARGAVIYFAAGAAAANPLVAYVDFNQEISSTNASFAVTFSAPLRFQN
ncbi:hypothetical protein MARCHEWKA_00390 [Brevundimonas phage vB_BpoS-Marchewka]|uniref:Uncharacterized protein n=1 Tax=Brevundimonas phage vB_BpoS-Marchewka TaxID=2948604 RepID=A0A9E7STP2_9CAUD|nr:hypothetical protein MARCHEWKA_00390 [Brevundimonas phage vB_BpoS-Marchewka]